MGVRAALNGYFSRAARRSWPWEEIYLRYRTAPRGSSKALGNLSEMLKGESFLARFLGGGGDTRAFYTDVRPRHDRGC